MEKEGGNTPDRAKKSGPNRISTIGAVAILVLFTSGIILSVLPINKTETEEAVSGTPKEDAWEARLRRDKEEWDKKQEAEIAASAARRQASIPLNKDTRIASIINAVSCAAKTGFMPRNQMGSTMKEMFEKDGINSTEVFENWDHYWGIAKEMDAFNKTYCLK